MKKTKMIFAMMLAMIMVFAGCGGFKFEMTRIGNSTEIKINADDGSEAETDYFSVGKKEYAAVTSSLKKGSVEIEFVEAEVFVHTDEEDDVYPGEVYTTITISEEEEYSVSLDPGEYIMRIKAIGSTEGTVNVKIQKAN